MGQKPSCCADEGPEVPKEVLEAAAYGESMDSSTRSVPRAEDDAGPAPDAAVTAATIAENDTRTPSKWSRMEKMSHLEVDTEILRGVSLRATLRSFGRLWRQSPIDLAEEDRAGLWDRSEPVEAFDIFLSHTWRTPGRWKVLSLLFQSGLWFTLLCTVICVATTVTLCLTQVIPMPFTFLASHPRFSEECPYSPWPSVVGLVGTLFGLFLSPYFLDGCDKTICFLDVVSIHQVDRDLMERGIYGLGGFLRMSKELRVLWSEPYLSRLWCVFELAAYRHANPTGRIRLTPVFIEVGLLSLILGSYFAAFLFFAVFAARVVLALRPVAFAIALVPVYVLMHAMRVNTRAKHRLISELRGFDLNQASCRTDFDKEFIYSAIREWYGSTEAFTEYVRGPLREEMLGSDELRLQFPLPYLLLASTCPISASLNTLAALWVAGAPAVVVATEFMAFTLGFYSFWFLPMTKLAIYLCDRFAAPRWSGCCMDYLQTGLIFLCFFALYYAGDTAAMAVTQVGVWASSAWLLFSMLLCWVCCFGGWERLGRLTEL
eukprot:s2796_g17.t1